MFPRLRNGPSKFDLRSLRYVMAIADCGSFARAANTLALTQSALSRAIQALERSLGVPLFDRSKAGVVPTAHGRLMIERAKHLLADAHALEHEIRMLDSAEIGALAVGTGAYPADISVGVAASRLIARHPQVRLRLFVADWPELVREVLTDEIDLAVCEISGIEDDERLAIEPLPEHQGIFFCRKDHALANRPSIDLEDIKDFPLVFTSVPSRLAALLRQRKDAFGGTDVPDIHVDTFALARQIALGSDAIGAAAEFQLKDDVSAGRACVLPLKLSWLRSRYGFVRRNRRTPSPSARAFMSMVRTIERELEESYE